MPQACRAPQAPQVSKEKEVPLVSWKPLEVLAQKVSNGHGLGSHSLSPPPPATKSELAFQGENHRWALGTVCLSGEDGAYSIDCLYPGKAGCWIIQQCTKRMQGELPGTEGYLYVGGCTAEGYDSPCIGGGKNAGKCAQNMCNDSFLVPGPSGAISPQRPSGAMVLPGLKGDRGDLGEKGAKGETAVPAKEVLETPTSMCGRE